VMRGLVKNIGGMRMPDETEILHRASNASIGPGELKQTIQRLITSPVTSDVCIICFNRV
jgi:hypothetical protein